MAAMHIAAVYERFTGSIITGSIIAELEAGAAPWWLNSDSADTRSRGFPSTLSHFTLGLSEYGLSPNPAPSFIRTVKNDGERPVAVLLLEKPRGVHRSQHDIGTRYTRVPFVLQGCISDIQKREEQA
jgi:hypothetical protein